MRIARQYLPLVFCLLLQAGFWWQTHAVLPDMSIVPDVPGRQTVKALSLGDDQFYFRVLALRLQNCGDTFGRFTALYKYDFKKLRAWFSLLDQLDTNSNMVPAMAAYYFSQTQHRPDVRYVVDYLYEHSAPRVEKKWWWLVQAIYLANHKLNDKDLALKVAQPLTTTRNIPIWAQQMPAFVHEQRGEFEDAFSIMQGIQRDIKVMPKAEVNFMKYFINERLKKLQSAIGESEDTSPTPAN